MAATKKKATVSKISRKKATTKKAGSRKKVARKSGRKKAAATRVQKNGKTDGTPGRPPFTATPEQRKMVETLVGYGLTHDEVKVLIINPETGKPISRETLRKHFPDELERGKPLVASRIAESLYRRAIDLKHPQGAQCAMFFAKCKMGWRQEEKVIHEVEGNTAGVLIAPAAVDPSEWLRKHGKVDEDPDAEGDT